MPRSAPRSHPTSLQPIELNLWFLRQPYNSKHGARACTLFLHSGCIPLRPRLASGPDWFESFGVDISATTYTVGILLNIRGHNSSEAVYQLAINDVLATG